MNSPIRYSLYNGLNIVGWIILIKESVFTVIPRFLDLLHSVLSLDILGVLLGLPFLVFYSLFYISPAMRIILTIGLLFLIPDFFGLFSVEWEIKLDNFIKNSILWFFVGVAIFTGFKTRAFDDMVRLSRIDLVDWDQAGNYEIDLRKKEIEDRYLDRMGVVGANWPLWKKPFVFFVYIYLWDRYLVSSGLISAQTFIKGYFDRSSK